MAHDEEVLRILPLGELKDFDVAEGYPDIRGWKVSSTDGRHVGTVHELLVDVDTMRTRYLDVRLTPEIAAMPGDRDVLIPIGTAQLDSSAKHIIVPLLAERVSLLPAYGHGGLTRTHELEVRRHFSLGEAAATAVAGTAAAAGAAGAAVSGAAHHNNFYDDRYDDRRFFSKRSVQPGVSATNDSAVRIPVSPDDTVVLKKGDNGNDEIIIRRPLGGDQRSHT